MILISKYIYVMRLWMFLQLEYKTLYFICLYDSYNIGTKTVYTTTMSIEKK